MTTSHRFAAVFLPLFGAMGIGAGTGHAQPLTLPASPEVLLTTHFRSPLSYEKALTRLDEYYDQELGRKAGIALPLIGPRQHFDLWHDMWVLFDATDGGTTITIKRPVDGTTSRLAKGWMLNLAGHVDGAAPLEFKEEAALHSVDADLYLTARDLSRIAASDGALKLLATWEHQGLAVSTTPMVLVTLAPAGLHGSHHVVVTAETTAAAKLLLSRIQQGIAKPGIYAASSEDAEIEEEIKNTAQGKADTLGVTTSQAIYIPQMDPKLIEMKVRADPEMSKRLAAAQHQYDIRFRIDKPYRKIVVTWTELVGATPAGASPEAVRPLGKSILTAPKPPSPNAPQLVARTRLEPLKPGAYRLTLEGESSTAELQKIDERTFWFDGRVFEEM
uniref:Uncharacterized protein n=1 Tax=Solibacter usitatus (strain Ellin6076) TaxID=234267 RepID=Q026A0_SOLUE